MNLQLSLLCGMPGAAWVGRAERAARPGPHGGQGESGRAAGVETPPRREPGLVLSPEGSTAAWQRCWSPAAVLPPWQVPGRGPATRHPSAQTTRRAPLLSAPGAPGARGKGTGVCSPSVHLSVYPCVPLSNTSINLSIHPSLVHICFSIQPSVQPPELSICPSLPPPRGAACPGGLCLQTPRDPPAAPSWCSEPSWRAGCVHGTVTAAATVRGTCREGGEAGSCCPQGTMSPRPWQPGAPVPRSRAEACGGGRIWHVSTLFPQWSPMSGLFSAQDFRRRAWFLRLMVPTVPLLLTSARPPSPSGLSAPVGFHPSPEASPSLFQTHLPASLCHPSHPSHPPP